MTFAFSSISSSSPALSGQSGSPSSTIAPSAGSHPPPSPTHPCPSKSPFVFRLPIGEHQATPSPITTRAYRHVFGSAAKRSDKYWFEDGSVVIEVKDTIYKVYKGVLTRQSKLFVSNITAVLQSPPVTATITDSVPAKKGKKTAASRLMQKTVQPDPPRLVGTGSEENPVVLNVAKSDFELLLSCLFPLDYEHQYDFTTNEWSAIVGISERLEFKSIKSLAIANLLKISSTLDLIDIGRGHSNHECYLEGFRQLCTRETSLNLEEGHCLGVECIIAIAQAREMIAKGSKWTEIEPLVQFEVEAKPKDEETGRQEEAAVPDACPQRPLEVPHPSTVEPDPESPISSVLVPRFEAPGFSGWGFSRTFGSD